MERKKDAHVWKRFHTHSNQNRPPQWDGLRQAPDQGLPHRIGASPPGGKSWTEREKNAIMQRIPPRGEKKNEEKAKNDPAEQGKNITTTAD